MPPVDDKNQKQQVQLPPNNLQLFESVSTRYDAEIPQGVAPEHLLEPAFWAHQAVKLRPMDEIRARAIDGTWVGTYVVLDCSRTWARVRQLSFSRLTTGEVAETQASEQAVRDYIAGHNVAFRGAQHKWSITRKADKAVIEEGIAEKDEATKRLEALARSHVGGAAATARTPVTA
jgi:hypothetical protein